MKANSNKSKQGNKAAHRVVAGVLCGASVLSLVLSLVMPPISQAIANDAQMVSTEETGMGGGSSSESTDVDNTTNGDTENQNSDVGEGDETSGDAATAGLSSDGTGAEGAEQPADDGANDENEVMSAAADDSIELNQDNIDEKFGRDGRPGKYILAADLTYDGTITLGQGETVINLNGHKIKHESADQPLFNITGGATLTIKDLINDSDPEKASEKVFKVKELNNQGQNFNPDNYGKAAEFVYTNGIPSSLTYYVTESSSSTADITKTTETLSKHSVDIKGAIVACNSSNRVSLIKLDGEGCTFNLQSGVLTQEEKCNVAHLIDAQNHSIVNMSGGYVCGASVGSDGAGAGISINGSTLKISNGVIAGNYAPSGGGVYARDSMVEMTGGIISGNGTNDNQRGYGAGICAEKSNVTISNGYITNNKYQFYVNEEQNWKHLGFGCHGGGGIAAFNGGSLKINGGYVTGNYSAEAGGGIYAGAWNQALDSFTFSGGTVASNVAQNSEGGGIRISAPTVGKFNVSGNKAYITNNTTNTTNDWGGGGVFVQGSSDNNVQPASLGIYNALITNNHANGFGGGFAACPTGKTAITDTNGIAIFGNSDGKPDGSGYNRSGGTNGKNEDRDADPNGNGGEITPDFISAGHKDLFLVHDSNNSENNPYIAAVTGQMLGGGAANWSGTIDDNTSTSIGKYEGAQAKYLIGLKSDPFAEDQKAAKGLATLYITGNSSNIHGGGIMTNGNVVAGSTQGVQVYPKMKLNGSKVFEDGTLKGNDFDFQLLKQNEIKDGNGRVTGYTVPSFDANGTLQPNDCSMVNTVKNDGNGKFAFDLGEVYADDDLVYYLVEVPGTDKDVDYDKTIYKIDPKVVKNERKSHKVLDIEYTYYTVESVTLTKIAADGSKTDTQVNPKNEDGIACVDLTVGATFTNTYTQYTSSGSWTPEATKVVEGGEMKEFTLQLATDKDFTKSVQKSTQPGADKSQTLSFDEIKYVLDDLTKGEDSTGRGASKTFTYYVREQQPTTPLTNYKYDQSVYKITVNATDRLDKTIKCDATYTKIVDAKGKEIAEADQEPLSYGEDTNANQSLPTFTNTYSTTLPLSGMSGVTLTYLAGAAVLCAAAAWMHIRRKANAKGGERRE